MYWTDLNPTKGSEQSGKRPVVVISGNTMNENLPACIVCPLSSQIKYASTCTTLKKSKTNKLKNDSEVITFQI
jgi:mRNA interferase MazF